MTQTTKPTESSPSTHERRWLPAVAAIAGLATLGTAIAIARPAAAPDDLSILAAIILGLVEGITEYLPVSSTGHLLVTQRLLGLGGTEQADLALDTYAICIQAGAILAVLLLYRNRITQMTRGAFGRDPDGARITRAAIAAFAPTVVIALAVQDPVRDRLFGPWPIAAAWIVGGVAILVLVRSGRLDRPGAALVNITTRQAIIIGITQTLALWPGVSRSLTTIVVAVLVGLSLSAAVEFSFLLGLITLSAASAYEALNNGANLVNTFGYTTPLIGLVVAFLSAMIAVRWMVARLEQQGIAIFGWYRIVAGAALVAALTTGAI